MFKALLLESTNKKTVAQVRLLDEDLIAQAEVLIDVAYSSLNYKDGLAITGKGHIIKQFPMVPGIDFSGIVRHSEDPRYLQGDKVVLTGWGVGEKYWGGLASVASVKADWLVPLENKLSMKQAMQIGTAGLTAMLCVQALLDAGLQPGDGEVVVTGASGGVGSVAVALLGALGFKVAAVTGRVLDNSEYLQSLGATRIIDRKEFSQLGRPLDKQCWAGAIDTAGSVILANLLAQMNYGGVVAACGLAAGFDLPTTVMPFILRGVKLSGIDSVAVPFEKRQQAWQKLAELLPDSFYQQACCEISLEQVIDNAELITQGKITGRVVVAL